MRRRFQIKNLETLCQKLESGGPIPAQLANSAAATIRKAVSTNEPLLPPVRKKVGRPPANAEKFDRAYKVAELRITNNLSVNEAIIEVANGTGKKFSTIEKDYKKLGKYVRPIFASKSKWPEWKRLSEELKQLLLTFRDEHGHSPTIDEVERLVDSLPAQELRQYVEKIKGGSFRRDLAFFESVFSTV